MPEAPTQTAAVVWHRLMDGPPPKSGKYLVAHRGIIREAYYNPEGLQPGTRARVAFTERRMPMAHEPGPRRERGFPTDTWGWSVSISWATHWAEPPYPSDGDGAIQLCREAGRNGYCDAREAQWSATHVRPKPPAILAEAPK